MKNALFHIVLFFTSIIAFGQKPMVQLTVDPKTAEVGDVLTISVKSNVNGNIEIDYPSGFVHGYNIMTAMEPEMDQNTGKIITYYYFSQTGAIGKEGTYTFGPAYVKRGNKVYRSNTVTITIQKENSAGSLGSDVSSKQLKQPAFGVIQQSKKTLYEGEPIIVSAKVYSRFHPTHLENYQTYSLDGVIDKHEIGNTSNIMVEQERFKGQNLFAFEYDRKVLFPTGTGRQTISPYKLILHRGLESMALTSSSAVIDVKPLPGGAPKSFIGGVGQFTVSRTIQEGPFRQGDVFTLAVTVSGYGNLQNILEPKLDLPKGFLIYGDPVVKEDLVFGPKGAEGKITFEFNIQITRFGDLLLPATSIAFFDPVKEKYITVSTSENNMVVEKNDQFKIPVSDNDGEPEIKVQEAAPLRADHGDQLPSGYMFNSTPFWTLVSAPVFLGLLSGIWFRRKRNVLLESARNEHFKRSQQNIRGLFSEAEDAIGQGHEEISFALIEKAIHRSMGLYLKGDETYHLTRTEILNGLIDRGVSPAICDRLKSIMDTCETARYGFGMTEINRRELLNETKELTEQIFKS